MCVCKCVRVCVIFFFFVYRQNNSRHTQTRPCLPPSPKGAAPQPPSSRMWNSIFGPRGTAGRRHKPLSQDKHIYSFMAHASQDKKLDILCPSIYDEFREHEVFCNFRHANLIMALEMSFEGGGRVVRGSMASS